VNPKQSDYLSLVGLGSADPVVCKILKILCHAGQKLSKEMTKRPEMLLNNEKARKAKTTKGN